MSSSVLGLGLLLVALTVAAPTAVPDLVLAPPEVRAEATVRAVVGPPADPTTQAAVGRPADPTKRALIIAIGAYPRPEVTGYRILNAGNDVPLVRGALSRHGFADITVLKDADAKRDAIMAALDEMLSRSQPGDVVAIHYSGHGHRLTDDSGDEADGYDEVLVPYAASAKVGPDYDGSGHIRDDDFGRAIAAIGERVAENGAAGQVLVTIDACYSGSITRSTLPVRGDPDPIGPPGMNRWQQTADSDYRERLLEGDGEMPESVVVISAAQFGELDHEVRAEDGVVSGPLSLAMSRVMADLPAGSTYQLLYERLRAEMARYAKYQTPTIEGAAGTPVFGGQISEPVIYHRVARFASDTVAVLDAGHLAGIRAGSAVEFRLPEASGFKTLSDGRVLAANEMQSFVRIRDDADRDQLKAGLAFVSERSFGSASRSVVVDSMLSQAFVDAFDAALANGEGGATARRVYSADEADYRLEAAYDGAALFAATRVEGAAPLRRFNSGASGGITAARVVKALAIGRYLETVELRDPALSVVLDYKPATLAIENDGFGGVFCDPAQADTTTHDGLRSGADAWKMPAGQGFVLGIENNSPEDLYMNVLSVLSNGDVTVMYPASGSVTDNLVSARSSFLLPSCWMTSDVNGREVIKLFATRDPLNLATVLADIDAGDTGVSRSDGSAFADVLLDMSNGLTRSESIGRRASPGSTSRVFVYVEND